MMKSFPHRTNHAQIAALTSRAPDLFVQPQEPPKRGMFLLSFNNRRKQLGGFETCECEGTRYSSGFVHLDTQFFPIREFTDLAEMQDVLGAYGDCELTWLGSEVAS